jgi:hypothetical protein
MCLIIVSSASLFPPTIIGKPKFPGVLVGMDQKEFYVGNEAKGKKHLLKDHSAIMDFYIH